MNERTQQLLIGLMVLAAGIVAATLIVMFGEGPEMFQPHYTIYIKADSAEGVNDKTAIRMRGVLIGRVSGVKLLDGGVLISARINSDRKIHENELCRIYPSVLGEADVNFVLPAGEEPSPKYLAQGATVPAVVAREPMQVIGDLQGDFAQMIRSVTATTDETRQTMARIAKVFEDNQDRINSIVAKTDANMDIMRQTMTNANKLIGDEKLREELKQTAAEMPELMRNARSTLDKIGRMTESADRNLNNLEEFTLALRDQGTEAIGKLDDGAAKLRFVMDQMATFSQTLNRTDTNFGMLMHDRQLYDNINRTAENLEELSRALRPVVNDARVFTDKIARHPELLGVRGAMHESIGTKGVPGYPTLR